MAGGAALSLSGKTLVSRHFYLPLITPDIATGMPVFLLAAVAIPQFVDDAAHVGLPALPTSALSFLPGLLQPKLQKKPSI